MSKTGSFTIALTVLLALTAATARAEISEDFIQDARKLYPLRIRDMAFPGVMILGFEPTPARGLPKGTWFYEAHYSQASNFMVNDAVESYLETRDDDSRGINLAVDVPALEALGEEVFYVDGESGRLDVNVHFGLTDRLNLVVGAGYITYTGGSLDSLIYNFHENFGIDQNGRDLIAEDELQILFAGVSPNTTFFQGSSPGGGIADPTVRLRWGSETIGKDWNLGVEGAVKFAVGEEDQLHSSGNEDFGVQFAANKTWNKTGLILNAYYVLAGDFEQASEDFDQADPIGFSVAYLRTMGEIFTLNAQALSQRNLFEDATDSSLSDPEFQASIGFTARVAHKSFFQFSYTNNLINYDNTPDLVFHAGFSQFFD